MNHHKVPVRVKILCIVSKIMKESVVFSMREFTQRAVYKSLSCIPSQAWKEDFWLIIHRCLSYGIMHSDMSLLRFLFVIYGVCLKVLGYNPGTSWQNREAFAALKEDGTVMAWGNSGFGGNDVPLGLNYVNVIYATAGAFAALKEDGTVRAWGNSDYGGSGVPSGLSGVKTIYTTYGAFVALKDDSTVTAWGHSDYGGHGPQGLSGVNTISSNPHAFAALKEDGTVVAWGDPDFGRVVCQ